MLKTIGIGTMITLLLLGSLYNFFPAPEDTHFCEDRMISHPCNKLSKYYSLDNGKCWSTEGNKLCRSGWIEIDRAKIPEKMPEKGLQYLCPPAPEKCEIIK